MQITDNQRVLLLSPDTNVRDMLKLLSRRLNRPDLLEDVLDSFEPETRVDKAARIHNTSIGSNIAFTYSLLDQIYLTYPNGEYIGALNLRQSSDDLISITLDKKSCFMRELKDRENEFPAATYFLDYYTWVVINETEFTDALCLKAVRDAQNGDYNAMLLLGSLYTTGLLSDIIDDGLGKDDTNTLLEILSGYGYDTDKLGDCGFSAIISSFKESMQIEFYAKNPEDAIKILGTHLDINNDYFIVTQPNREANAIMYVESEESLLGDRWPLRDVVLSGKISDYTGKPNTRNKIKI